MPKFSKRELNLIYLYDPGNLKGLIYELRSMMAILMPDEKALYRLADKTVKKLETMTAADYKTLTEIGDPISSLLHFDLGLEAAAADDTETED